MRMTYIGKKGAPEKGPRPGLSSVIAETRRVHTRITDDLISVSIILLVCDLELQQQPTHEAYISNHVRLLYL